MNTTDEGGPNYKRDEIVISSIWIMLTWKIKVQWKGR